MYIKIFKVLKMIKILNKVFTLKNILMSFGRDAKKKTDKTP